MFEDETLDERLLFFTVDLLAKVGRKDDAEAHLWRAFEKQPSYELYQRLRKIGGKAGSERVIELLKARFDKKSRSHWLYAADLLVRILTHEKMYDAAWAAKRQYQTSNDVRQELAHASEVSHPREALEVYAARVEELINVGGYAQAVKLVSRMAPLRNATEQASYISALRVRRGRKRNLMKLL